MRSFLQGSLSCFAVAIVGMGVVRLVGVAAASLTWDNGWGFAGGHVAVGNEDVDGNAAAGLVRKAGISGKGILSLFARIVFPVCFSRVRHVRWHESWFLVQ